MNKLRPFTSVNVSFVREITSAPFKFGNCPGRTILFFVISLSGDNPACFNFSSAVLLSCTFFLIWSNTSSVSFCWGDDSYPRNDELSSERGFFSNDTADSISFSSTLCKARRQSQQCRAGELEHCPCTSANESDFLLPCRRFRQETLLLRNAL